MVLAAKVWVLWRACACGGGHRATATRGTGRLWCRGSARSGVFLARATAKRLTLQLAIADRKVPPRQGHAPE
jgi:hypothetical protein